MFNVLKNWFFKYFGDPEAAILLIVLLLTFLFIWLFGQILAPLLAGLVLAYLLDGVITALQTKIRCPRGLAITLVYSIFIGLFVYALIALLPTLYKQFVQLVSQIPQFIASFHDFIASLPSTYPGLISNNTAQSWITSTDVNLSAFSNMGSTVLASSFTSMSKVMTALIYVFLIPLVTFFFLKDKKGLLKSFDAYMPDQRGLILEVAHEMRLMTGRYVRGKAFEILLVTALSWIGFAILHLNYAFLLGLLVGLSAIIPYVGAIVVTIPVALIALIQFGTSPDFVYVMLIYGIIQVLDGNLLVPLLYSGAVNLNPVVIITAVLFFGGIWGFWGLFFAIPLATLVKAVVQAWMRHANRT
ncbi:MAG: AI-2E family transporter [Gammaproteobacteria bacterium]|nr:AI-2E family transporter [Gammaproteobacteria bacterium]